MLRKKGETCFLREVTRTLRRNQEKKSRNLILKKVATCFCCEENQNCC